MRKKIFILAAVVLLLGCGSAPEAPHIYVIGVDCSRSFWSTSLVSEKRFTDLSRTRIREISYRIREYLNELNVITESPDFIVRTRLEAGTFVKTVDRELIRTQIENSIEMITMLSDSAGSSYDKGYLSDRIKYSMSELKLALKKRNYIRIPESSNAPEYNEGINPASMVRVNKQISRVNAELDKFTYTVSVPNQPALLSQLKDDIYALLNIIDDSLGRKNAVPIDERWVESGIYGKLKELNPAVYFIIGNAGSTVCKPRGKEIDSAIDKLINASYEKGVKVFNGSSNYEVFIQRSFSEISNLVNSWEDFDQDIGMKVSFIIVGDGKNDPKGKYEDGVGYDRDLLSGIEKVFRPESGQLISGVSDDSLKEVSVKFCVPQKRYNTDVLDSWAKLLGAGGKKSKIQVKYHMFENLKEKGKFTRESVRNLID
ncbi:MAG: hypothetical protein JW803_00210 [Endomicrobiales bacterium]|nr:hypothetical protein [Endomicrobiales bacterium]